MKTENLTLTNFNDRQFKIHTYILNDNPNTILQKRPLIIVVPGGSFDHLSLREGEPVALSYCAHGFNSVVMEYNLIQDEGAIYPDAGLDVLSTIKYFRNHAEEYNIDPSKIVTIGFSAGGHVVSVANNMAVSEKYQTKYHFEKENVISNATILGYPLINIEKIGFPIPKAAENDIPQELDLKDSALGVTRETPATFIFQAWDNPVVLISNSLEYIQALYDNQVNCEVHLFEKGGHGFSIARPEVVEKGREWQNNPHAARWFKLSLEWLKQNI